MGEADQHWKITVADEAFEPDVELTEANRLVLQNWEDIVTKYGPEGLLSYPGFWNDHELKGHWAGHRSSSFSTLGRIIYRVDKRKRTVVIVRITTEHDYGRKKQ